ncbi:MAG: ABC transporter permease [Ignavibacteria bacterium]|nr:ABC transporter permease [Ignavibacteria bacterium]
MNFKYFIAKRYLFSKKDSKFISFITYISILGIALGVATLIIAVSILNGFEKEIKEKVAGLVSHIQISSFHNDGLRGYDTTIAYIKETIPGISKISPYLQKEAVFRYKGNIEGVMVKGVPPASDISHTRLNIISGSSDINPFDSTYSRIIIGDKLASKMGIDTGSKVIVFGLRGIPSPANQPNIKQFYVSGIYETGLREYDDLLVYTDLKTAQKVFSSESVISAIEISLSDINEVERIAATLKNILRYPHYTRTMFQLYKELFTWVELQKAPTPIILGLIIIVATFNIIGTLLMLVLEKTQSIGILKAVGCSNGKIMKIFIFDGLIIGVFGIILGNIVGLGLSFLELNFRFFTLPEQYYMKSVPILLQAEYIVVISIITLILVFLATLIPSYIASRFDPVKSIRFV